MIYILSFMDIFACRFAISNDARVELGGIYVFFILLILEQYVYFKFYELCDYFVKMLGNFMDWS